MSNIFRKFFEDNQRRFQSHCKPEVLEFIAQCQTLSKDEYENLCKKAGGFNSYERHLLYPLMDDDLLIETAEYCLLNCSPDRRKPATTYDNVMLNTIAPLLIKKLKTKGKE